MIDAWLLEENCQKSLPTLQDDLSVGEETLVHRSTIDRQFPTQIATKKPFISEKIGKSSLNFLKPMNTGPDPSGKRNFLLMNQSLIDPGKNLKLLFDGKLV
uniref:Uncharacterized protein n=1 Tax=Romanomermis culicivorax TaxID=13658 RepID=A0A915K7J7_ROMCU